MNNLEQEESGFDFAKKISRKAWLVLAGFILLASLAFNGWNLWQKEEQKILEQGRVEGIEQGRQQVGNEIASEYLLTGQLRLNFGERSIILKEE